MLSRPIIDSTEIRNVVIVHIFEFYRSNVKASHKNLSNKNITSLLTSQSLILINHWQCEYVNLLFLGIKT